MNVYGIIGNPLVHSRSQDYFNRKFATEGILDSVYVKFEIDSIDALPDILDNNPDLRGFNVTIPYKQSVMQYLDSVSDEAARMGAVNCVKVVEGKLRGYNTDYGGFKTSLVQSYNFEKNCRALVLGTGGASKAVCCALRDLGIELLLVSRNRSKGDVCYEDIDSEMLRSHLLIVNTTPLGTWPDVDNAAPIPYELLEHDNMLFDLVYNPPLTKFLREGQLHDCRVKNGMDMFIYQAELSWSIFNAIV